MFDLNKLKSIKIRLASPETIRGWSYAETHGGPGAGEVLNSETINYRSLKPEPGGLFCQKIFGPSKDNECYCGKFKKSRYAGITCDHCGVEVTSRTVRRERMGYINLPMPCAHIWYVKGTPSKMATFLGISPKDLEEVIYFQSHIVVNPGKCAVLHKMDVISESKMQAYLKGIFEDMVKHADDGIDGNPIDPHDLNKIKGFLQIFKDNYPTPFAEMFRMLNRYYGTEIDWGSAPIKKLLQEVDVQAEYAKLKKELANFKGANSSQAKEKLLKRLDVVGSFAESGNHPEWMILDCVPVIPPDLRPMLQLEGGRTACSDINVLYQRLIQRVQRQKRLVEARATSVSIVNENRLLQEALDMLIDNGRRGKPYTNNSGRPYKSLSAALKGKQGRFRQNLLGKRVDYSGRSVICVGPFLRMDQCGLPREMAFELFRPIIEGELIRRNYVASRSRASELIDRRDPRALQILEEVVPHHPVLLNRAPTLHRLGIQAFRPVLVDGHALRLHPLVCPGFNADFDGDQMAIHVPLSKKAQQEAFDLMISTKNILSPRDATVLAIPVQDVDVGHFWLTSETDPEGFRIQADLIRENGKTIDGIAPEAEAQAAKMASYAKMDGHAYRNFDEVMRALDAKVLHTNNRIVLPVSALNKNDIPNYFTEAQKHSYIITTPGKLIFNNMFPKDFPYINDSPAHMDAKYAHTKSADERDVFKHPDPSWFVPFGESVAEHLKNWQPTGPVDKKNLAAIINKLVHVYGVRSTALLLDRIKDTGYDQCTKMGLTLSITDIDALPGREKFIQDGYQQVEGIEEMYDEGLMTDKEKHDQIVKVWTDEKDEMTKAVKSYMKLNPYNHVFMMANSGARGSVNNFVQLIGMRGVMAGPNNTTLEIPVTDNFRHGMTVNEYFIATHGARKGSTDTALKTADSGYLTRRLVDVSHSVVIREEDCGVDHGFKVTSIYTKDGKDVTLQASAGQRAVGRFLAADLYDKEGHLIGKRNQEVTEEMGHEIDAKGIDSVEIRSLLTCQAKEGVCVKCYGRNMATGEMSKNGDTVGIMAAQSIGEPGTQLTMRTFHEGGTAGSDITQGLPRVQELLEVRNPKGEATISDVAGKIVEIKDEEKESHGKTKLTGRKVFVIESANGNRDQVVSDTVNPKVIVNVGDQIAPGAPLTSGSIDPKKLLEFTDVWEAAKYIIAEVQKVYNAQSIHISDKHLEVIVREMIGKILVTDGGDTDIIPGTKVDTLRFTEINQKQFELGKRPAVGHPVILGVTKAALDTRSFLSSASFQETTKVLTDAAIKGKVDNLRGLKENVMIGKLIPAGTGVNPLPEDEDFVRKEEESLDDFNRIKSGLTESEFYDDELAEKELDDPDSAAYPAAPAPASNPDSTNA